MRTIADVLLHPVRLRVVQALAGGRRLTPADLSVELDDVAVATLYRHIATLAERGVIAVVDERPARGTPERVYALVDGAGSVSPEALAAATPDDHVRYFTTFAAGLIGEFGRYVTRPGADLAADGAGYRQVPLYLSDQELAELAGRLNAAVLPALGNGPAPGRRRRMFTTILIPTEATP